MNEKIKIDDKIYTILVKFDSKNTNKTYILYSTLESQDNFIDIYSAILNEDTIEPVDTEEEQKIIEKMINTLTVNPNGNYRLINQE